MREPGLYFVGLHFLHAFSPEMIHGVGRDAARIAAAIAARGAHLPGVHAEISRPASPGRDAGSRRRFAA